MNERMERSRLTVSDVVVLAIGAALFAALGNTLVVLLQIHALDRPSSATPDFAYLSPIGYGTVFAVVALPLLVLARVLPARIGTRVVPGAFATSASFALLSLIPRVHPLALLLVAIGIGTQVAITFGRRPAWARRGARWLAAAGAAGMLVTIGATLAMRTAAAAKLTRLRGVPDEDAPNVLLLILDTVRARNLSAYRYPRRTTPVIERLAASGVAFDFAYSTATFSAPSHASMVTGLWGAQTGADYSNAMNSAHPTLAQALNARGYVSGAFVANAVWAGRNVGIGRGFAHFEDFPLNFRQALWSTTLTQSRTGHRIVAGIRFRDVRRLVAAIRYPDLRFESYTEDRLPTPQMIERFWRWRDSYKGRPYFAMINFMDAHGPYIPPEKYRVMFGDSTRKLDRYDGAIAYLDDLVGGIVDALRERGELERTIIIVTADHGELLGEHGIEGHTESLYRRATRVPLIFSGGPVPAGIRVRPEVSLRDLAATVLDLTGLREHNLPGKSLRLAWQSGSNRDVSPVILWVPQGKNVGPKDLSKPGAIRGAVDSAWYYIRYATGREELFSRRDSLEVANLVATPAGRVAADHLRQLVDVELRSGSVGRPLSVAR